MTVTGALAVVGTALANETDTGTKSWMPQTWDTEADAVIIGYGCAGPIAAIALADQGYTSPLIEKMNREFAGDDCAVCGGYILASGDRTAESYITPAARKRLKVIYTVMRDARPYVLALPGFLQRTRPRPPRGPGATCAKCLRCLCKGPVVLFFQTLDRTIGTPPVEYVHTTLSVGNGVGSRFVARDITHCAGTPQGR